MLQYTLYVYKSTHIETHFDYENEKKLKICLTQATLIIRHFHLRQETKIGGNFLGNLENQLQLYFKENTDGYKVLSFF